MLDSSSMKQKQGKENFVLDLIYDLSPSSIFSLIIAVTATIVMTKALLESNSEKVVSLSQEQMVILKKLDAIDNRLSKLEGKIDMLVNDRRR